MRRSVRESTEGAMADVNEALMALVAELRAQREELREMRCRQTRDARPRSLSGAGLNAIPPFTGYAGEDVDWWLGKLEQVGHLEGWKPGEKLRAAIYKIEGAARCWHNTLGVGAVDWCRWTEELRAAFGRKYTLEAWTSEVNARRQGEDSRTYVYEKLAICRRCPVTLPEGDVIQRLAWGLLRPEVATAVMRWNWGLGTNNWPGSSPSGPPSVPLPLS